MEVAGSILDEVSFFFSEDPRIALRGGVAGSIPDELRKKNILGQYSLYI